MAQAKPDQWSSFSEYQGQSAGEYQQYLAEFKEGINQRMATFEQQAAKVEALVEQLEEKAAKTPTNQQTPAKSELADVTAVGRSAPPVRPVRSVLRATR